MHTTYNLKFTIENQLENIGESYVVYTCTPWLVLTHHPRSYLIPNITRVLVASVPLSRVEVLVEPV